MNKLKLNYLRSRFGKIYNLKYDLFKKDNQKNCCARTRLLPSNFVVLINTNSGNFGLIFSIYSNGTIWLFWWLFWENLKFSDIFRKCFGIFQKSLFCHYSIAHLKFVRCALVCYNADLRDLVIHIPKSLNIFM